MKVDELPQERGRRGASKPFKLEEFLNVQAAALAQRAASPLGRLERIDCELAQLLSAEAPATWQKYRRLQRELVRSARRELAAAERREFLISKIQPEATPR